MSSSADAAPSRKHLHIILVTSSDQALLTNISSVKENKYFDDTCVLEKGDHPFIKHRSYVAYNYSSITSIRDLNDNNKRGKIHRQEPISEETLTRICEGLLESKHTLPKIKNFYKHSIIEVLT